MKASSAIKMTDPKDYKETKLREYQHLIGKLMYLACDTRPNIAFAVDQLSKHNVNPRKGHLQAAKRVVRYLKRTMQMGLIFGKASTNRELPEDLPLYSLVGYVDNNFAGDSEN